LTPVNSRQCLPRPNITDDDLIEGDFYDNHGIISENDLLPTDYVMLIPLDPGPDLSPATNDYVTFTPLDPRPDLSPATNDYVLLTPVDPGPDPSLVTSNYGMLTPLDPEPDFSPVTNDFVTLTPLNPGPDLYLATNDDVMHTSLDDYLETLTSGENLVPNTYDQMFSYLEGLEDFGSESDIPKTNDLEPNFENQDDLLLNFLIMNTEPPDVMVPVNQELTDASNITSDHEILTRNPGLKTQMNLKPKTNSQRCFEYRERKKEQDKLLQQELKDETSKNSELKVRIRLLETEVGKYKKIVNKLVTKN